MTSFSLIRFSEFLASFQVSIGLNAYTVSACVQSFSDFFVTAIFPIGIMVYGVFFVPRSPKTNEFKILRTNIQEYLVK